MAPDQQETFTRLVKNHSHHAAPHPEHVLLEVLPVRKLDTGDRQADVRILIHQSLAVDRPPCPPGRRSLIGHGGTLPDPDP